MWLPGLAYPTQPPGCSSGSSGVGNRRGLFPSLQLVGDWIGGCLGREVFKLSFRLVKKMRSSRLFFHLKSKRKNKQVDFILSTIVEASFNA